MFEIFVAIPERRLLFNPFDPAPPPRKKLSEALSTYIKQEIKLNSDKKELRLVLVPSEHNAFREAELIEIFHHHFQQESIRLNEDIRRILKDGKYGAIAGLFCMIAAAGAASSIGPTDDNLLKEWIADGLNIFGWVAAWAPLDYLIFGWLGLARERRICRRLSAVQIRVMEDI